MTKPINAGLKSILALLIVLFFVACHGKGGSTGKANPEKPKEKDIVEEPEALNVRIGRNINEAIEFVLVNKGILNDSMVLTQDSLLNTLYQKRNYEPLWCNHEKWSTLSDSLMAFMGQAANYGLFPSDYHYRILNNIRHLTLTDSLGQKDAALWSRGDMLLSDAFFRLCYDLRKGRLPYDSLTLRKDSMGYDGYLGFLDQVQQGGSITNLLQGLEPKNPGYDSLKLALRDLLESVDTIKKFTHIIYPLQDTGKLYNNLRQRLLEEGFIKGPGDITDTASVAAVIRRYQTSMGLKVTGKLNENTVNKLNNTPWERFIRVAITLDRYKQLPDSMPATYIWVNIPAYAMRIVDSSRVALESRVIVGQPKTRTPELYSNVSNFITYPQWTVPYSIIFHEMLPRIKQSTDYLRRQNLIVVDNNDQVINPDSINWKKYGKNYFPYQIKQRQGDDNSLGVLKFNFVNKYDVYLHDTNARWLFTKENRALSHGCVRIKEFMKLADFLVRNDTIRYHPDTLRNWITRREKHVVSGFKRVPIFIRYFTCEAKEGKIRFYDDIYAEDKLLSERYFVNKTL